MKHAMKNWEVDVHIVGLIMTQKYSLKKGVELISERAEEATVKELSQIHSMDTYTPIHASDLCRTKQKKAFEALSFLTEKRFGSIKGRTCAIGSKQ